MYFHNLPAHKECSLTQQSIYVVPDWMLAGKSFTISSFVHIFGAPLFMISRISLSLSIDFSLAAGSLGTSIHLKHYLHYSLGWAFYIIFGPAPVSYNILVEYSIDLFTSMPILTLPQAWRKRRLLLEVLQILLWGPMCSSFLTTRSQPKLSSCLFHFCSWFFLVAQTNLGTSRTHRVMGFRIDLSRYHNYLGTGWSLIILSKWYACELPHSYFSCSIWFFRFLPRAGAGAAWASILRLNFQWWYNADVQATLGLGMAHWAVNLKNGVSTDNYSWLSELLCSWHELGKGKLDILNLCGIVISTYEKVACHMHTYSVHCNRGVVGPQLQDLRWVLPNSPSIPISLWDLISPSQLEKYSAFISLRLLVFGWHAVELYFLGETDTCFFIYSSSFVLELIQARDFVWQFM